MSEQTATWQLPDEGLAAEIVASQARMSAEHARHLDLVAEADQRGLASVTGYRTTDKMLVGVLHISQREATARLTQATLDIPRVRAALAAGEITPEHAFVIGKVLAETPDWVSTDQRAIDEEHLVTLAQQAIPSTVEKVADRLRGWWDADGKEPEDRDQDLARPRREFRYRWTKDGRFKFSGEFDHNAGRFTEDLFVTLAKPDPKDEHGNPDPRTTAERQGDAIVAALDLAARAPDLPVKSGERAVATVTIPYADLLKHAGDVMLDNGELLTASQLR